MVSGGAGMLNPSRLGARAAVEAVSIVHDVTLRGVSQIAYARA